MATFRVNKTQNFTVMSNHHLKDRTLSIRAKGLLSQMLSLPDDWDYSLRGLAKINNDGITAITSTVKELEKHGYIVRTRERDEMGRLRGMIYDIFEFPQERETDAPVQSHEAEKSETKPFAPNSGSPSLGKPSVEKPSTENQTQLNTNLLNTKKSKKEEENTQSYLIDEMDENDFLLVFETICHNIDYDILIDEYDKDEVDELVDLVVETISTKSPTVHVAKNEIPAEAARSRLLKLNHEHICYVLDCLRSNTTKVKNIKAYLLTALYNAPVTMQSYYRAKVNHDLRGE